MPYLPRWGGARGVSVGIYIYIYGSPKQVVFGSLGYDSSNKGIATRNKGITSSNKNLLVAMPLATSSYLLLVPTRPT